MKPENILITHDGILKLCDFGIVHDLRNVKKEPNALNKRRKRKFSFQESTLAQDGDARYLAFEVLSGIVSPSADIFSLGLAALELISDYDMPVTGDLWTSIRQLQLPTDITSVLTDSNLKQLLLQMIDADYKQRPTAKDILQHPIIRDEVNSFSIFISFFLIFVCVDQISQISSPFAFSTTRSDQVCSFDQ